MLNNRIANLIGPIAAVASVLLLLPTPGRLFAQGAPLSAQPAPGQAVAPGQGAPGMAQRGPEAAAEPPTEAERLIDVAIKKLAALKSVSADITQDVQMLKQNFAVKGRYLKAPSSRIYLKLTVSGLPDSSGTMLQVCDGETLWDYQQVLESQTYRRLSIKPVLERLNSPDIDPKMKEQILTGMGFSGPETLLVGLRKSVRFDQKEEGVYEGKPVYLLRGTWRSRNGLVGPDQRPVPVTGPLPAVVPSQATLTLGKEDGWPYKLVMVGKVPTVLQDTRRIGPDGKPIGSKSSIEAVVPSRIDLIYSNVQLNPNVRIEEFAFQAPPSAAVEDNTEAILKTLDQAIQYQALQKKAEANRQDGPVLDQPIEIPKSTTDPTPR